jgi:hypothetical protein
MKVIAEYLDNAIYCKQLAASAHMASADRADWISMAARWTRLADARQALLLPSSSARPSSNLVGSKPRS